MINIPESNLKRVVIVGGGFGGVEVAKHIDSTKYQIVMLDRNNYHTFQPLLYQVATGGLEPDSIAYPLRKIFKGRKNFYFRIAEVTNVIPEFKQIETSSGILAYDYLIIATGSITNYFNNSEIEKNAMPLKSVTDALNLRSFILQNFERLLLEPDGDKKSRLLNIVIVGGGPTGVEIAGALAELKKHVLPNDYPELNIDQLHIYLVESSERLLSGMAEISSAKAFKFLTDFGIDIKLKTAVEKYSNNIVSLNNSEQIETTCLIWTAGVKARLISGISANNISEKKRYMVDEYNKLNGSEDIFVIGDAASVTSSIGSFNHPMLAPVAMQQGKNLAYNLNRGINTSWKKFKYSNPGIMATIGRNKAVVELGKIKFYGIPAWFVWMMVHLMAIVGFRNRVVVFVNWVWNYFSYDRAIRLIIRPYKKTS